MKANELRIGNWYYWIDNGWDEPLKVDVDCFVHWKPNCMAPIPLTPEILEKAAFVKHTENTIGNVVVFKTERLEMVESPVYGFSFRWDGRHITYVKYVHKLQNLYFALTGEELSIQL